MYCGMSAGPAGAARLTNGSVWSHASKATLKSGVKRFERRVSRSVFPAECACSHAVKIRRVGGEALVARGRRRAGREAVVTGTPVEHRLPPVPLGGLEAAPRGGDGHDREQQDFEDLEDAVPALVVARAVTVLLLGQRVRDLDVGPFGHAGLLHACRAGFELSTSPPPGHHPDRVIDTLPSSAIGGSRRGGDGTGEPRGEGGGPRRGMPRSTRHTARRSATACTGTPASGPTCSSAR